MEKKYYWTDLESGFTFECSKEYHDSMTDMMNRIWEAAKPKINPDFIGKIIITGTGGENYENSK